MEAPLTRGRPTVEPDSTVAPGAELVAAARVLVEDLPHLVREELALAKVEARVAARSAAARGAIAGALGMVLLLGTFFLAQGAAVAVTQALERAWAGPVVVGGALVLFAAVALPIALAHRSPSAAAGEAPSG